MTFPFHHARRFVVGITSWEARKHTLPRTRAKIEGEEALHCVVWVLIDRIILLEISSQNSFLGGSGRTQTTLHFVVQSFTTYRTGVAFLNAASMASLVVDFGRLHDLQLGRGKGQSLFCQNLAIEAREFSVAPSL